MLRMVNTPALLGTSNMPTIAELIFWIGALVCSLLGTYALFNLSESKSSYYLDDVEAWNRNYTKIQRRR